MSYLVWAVAILLPASVLFLYIRFNDAILQHVPDEVLALSPTRVSPQDVREVAARLEASPKSVQQQIPPKTGRRYVVVGGSGFLGGWVVMQLLSRGEDPKRIRVLDIVPPVRGDLTTGLAKEVQFIIADITKKAAVQAAFLAPWPVSDLDASDPNPELTVFHTAANIRFYERHPSLIPLSARVNVDGTQNVLDAARNAGASVLISTSSGSVSVHSGTYLAWPWASGTPKHYVQVVDDNDSLVPKRHVDFFSNYAFTKYQGEKLVRGADKTASGNGKIRTGCIRPGNGVFGPGGDAMAEIYLQRGSSPTWITPIVQSCIYVENCALAHLLYEQRLIETTRGSPNPDIGGSAFCVSDPGPTPTFGDIYTTLNVLSDGKTTFPLVSGTAMLLLAHVLELYHLTRQSIRFLPPLGGDIVNVQPSLFNLMVHLVFDDSRARLSPEKGGLGYEGGFTTVEGLYRTVEEYKRGFIFPRRRAWTGPS